jgi:hypothetical protein
VLVSRLRLSSTARWIGIVCLLADRDRDLRLAVPPVDSAVPSRDRFLDGLVEELPLAVDERDAATDRTDVNETLVVDVERPTYFV